MQTQVVLEKHGIVLPQKILLKIEKCMIFTKADSCMKYRPKNEVMLCDLQSLLEDLSDFMCFLQPSLDFLVFLAENNNFFLKKFIEYYKIQCKYFTTVASDSSVSSSDKDVIALNHVVELSEKHLYKLVHGTITFSEVLSIFSIEVLREKVELNDELALVDVYLQLKLGHHGGSKVAKTKEGLLALVTLFQAINDLKILLKSCEVFQLEMCLKDPKMEELQAICKELSSLDFYKDITLEQGIEKLHLINENLTIDYVNASLIFELISAVQYTPRLYSFCKSKGFVSADGYQRFIAEHKLVTIAMEKEDYCEEILNQLRGAMVFIHPFFNHNNNLFNFMNQLKGLTNIPVGIVQLECVESDIEKVELSFNSIEVSYFLSMDSMQ